jgi:serine/threonine protein kinase
MRSSDTLDVDDFKKIKVIGKGAYGKVHLTEYKGKKYAMKQVEKDFVLQAGKI